MVDALQPRDWEIRTAAYRHLIDTFTAPAVDDIAAAVDLTVNEVGAGLRRLDAGHQIVLAPGQMRIWMLHPFSATPTAYPVEVEGGRYWGNCAWDAFGIPAVLGCDSRTPTRCAESGTPIEFGVRNGELVGGRGEGRRAVVHFAVPARQWYDNIAFT